MNLLLEQPVESLEVPLVSPSESHVPTYQSEGAAGADIRAHIDKAIVLEPTMRTLVPTGLCIQLPKGYELQVRPRSGLALKYGISVLNSPGTIDSDYRGEIQVILINHGQESFTIQPNMRIAQVVIAPVIQVSWRRVVTLDPSIRGERGFGDSGTD